jgi:hypothetical protein
MQKKQITRIIELFDTIKMLFNDKKYLFAFLIAFILLFFAYNQLTPKETRIENAIIRDALVLIMAFLSSFGLVVAIYPIIRCKTLSTKNVCFNALGMGIGGSALSFLGLSCIFCNPSLIIFLGLGGLSSIILEYNLYVILISILILVYSIINGIKFIEKICPR